MPNYCAVQNCKSYSRNKRDCRYVKFFSFPKNENISREWMKACSKNNINVEYERVCSIHFNEEDWRLKDRLLNTPLSKRLLNPNAIPSQFLPSSHQNTPDIREMIAEKETSREMRNTSIQDYELSILKQEIENNHLGEFASNSKILNGKIEPEVEVYAKKNEIKKLEKQLEDAKKENIKLKKQCEKLRSLETSVTSIFTSGQIKKLKYPKTKCNWSIDAISTALCLYSEGPRAYRCLYKRSFPIPSPLTVKKLALQLNVQRK